MLPSTAHLILLAIIAAACSVGISWAWSTSVIHRRRGDPSIGSLSSQRGSDKDYSRRGLQMVSQIEPNPAKALVDLSAAAGYRWISHYAEVQVPSLHGIHLSDITKQVQAVVEESGVLEGQVNVLSRHTTTAITINEMEGRLVDDARQYLLKLAPASYPYLHNDLHLRKGPPGWPGGDEAWRAQEPVNAHSHLLVMLLGSSETVPIHKGRLMLGTWQSLIMVELDGPRTRNVAVQVIGSGNA